MVACQSVPFVYPALDERLPPEARPPLIEHGGAVAEALKLPKHLTARYVGVCRRIRDAAAARMPDRPHHAIEIPPMVDLSEFDPADREGVREELGVPEAVPLIGWVGRLDRKKRVEDFLRAAALVRARHPEARFVVLGGPNVSVPEYADELARELALGDALTFLGDRADVPRLLSGLDVFVWLSRDEGMPRVVSEADAAALPVVATRDNGSEEQIMDDVTGLFVPHETRRAVASELGRLIRNPRLRRRLGRNLRLKVEREYGAAAAVARRWEELFDRSSPRPRAPGAGTTAVRARGHGAEDCPPQPRRRPRRSTPQVPGKAHGVPVGSAGAGELSSAAEEQGVGHVPQRQGHDRDHQRDRGFARGGATSRISSATQAAFLNLTSDRSRKRAAERNSPASIANPRKTVAKPGPDSGARARLSTAITAPRTT